MLIAIREATFGAGQIVQRYDPPRSLAGRMGGIKVKNWQAHSDLTIRRVRTTRKWTFGAQRALLGSRHKDNGKTSETHVDQNILPSVFFSVFVFLFSVVLFSLFSCLLFFFFLFSKNKYARFLTFGMVKGGSTRDAFTQKVALSGLPTLQGPTVRAFELANFCRNTKKSILAKLGQQKNCPIRSVSGGQMWSWPIRFGQIRSIKDGQPGQKRMAKPDLAKRGHVPGSHKPSTRGVRASGFQILRSLGLEVSRWVSGG